MKIVLALQDTLKVSQKPPLGPKTTLPCVIPKYPGEPLPVSPGHVFHRALGVIL